eukprot:1806339-Amphidinium_carterae.1
MCSGRSRILVQGAVIDSVAGNLLPHVDCRRAAGMQRTNFMLLDQVHSRQVEVRKYVDDVLVISGGPNVAGNLCYALQEVKGQGLVGCCWSSSPPVTLGLTPNCPHEGILNRARALSLPVHAKARVLKALVSAGHICAAHEIRVVARRALELVAHGGPSSNHG